MRIGFVDASVGCLTGGTESIIYNLALILARTHEVVVVTGSAAGAPILPHIRRAPITLIAVPFLHRSNPRNENFRSRFRMPLCFDIEAMTLFASFLRSVRARQALGACDALSFHYPTTSILFTPFARWRGIPSVFHCPGHVWGRRFFVFSRTEVYLANSRTTEAAIWRQTGRHADGVVTPGVPSALTADPSPARRTDAPVLLNVGRQTRTKGVYRLLRIFRAVCDALPAARLLVVGKNYEGDALLQEIKCLGLTGAVELAGEISYEQLPNFYARADVLVHPSFHESFGMVPLESLLYGVPAVISDIPHFREATGGIAEFAPIMEDEKWSEPLIRNWAARVIALVRDPARRDQLARDGRCHAARQSWEEKAREYERFLSEAVRRRAAARR